MLPSARASLRSQGVWWGYSNLTRTTLSHVLPQLQAGASGPIQRRCITIQQLDDERNGRERLICLGSGWAGFTVARTLDPKKFQVVIVSPRSYFAFTPLLASTAVGTLEFRTALEPVRSRRTKVNFFQGWADDVDFKKKTITIEEAVDDPKQGMALTADRHEGKSKLQREITKKKNTEKGKLFELTYDKLIVSVGAYSQTFNIPGVKEHAFFLKDVGDARKIRNRLLACFEGAALPTTSDEMRKQLLNFAIVGGGPTGIEFSAELHDLINEDMAKIYPELIPYHKITVYDVASKVLPMFDEKLATYATQKFNRKGIDIRTQHIVEELRPGGPAEKGTDSTQLYTLKIKQQGEIGVGMCVWSTGLMQNPFVAQALSDVSEAPDNLLVLNSATATPIAPSSLKWKVKKHPKSGSIITDSHLRVKLVPSESSASPTTASTSTSISTTAVTSTKSSVTATESNIEAIHPSVFALGDCGVIENTSYPATAQVASQKALWLAKRLNAITPSPPTASFFSFFSPSNQPVPHPTAISPISPGTSMPTSTSPPTHTSATTLPLIHSPPSPPSPRTSLFSSLPSPISNPHSPSNLSQGFTFRDLGTLAYIGSWNALFQGSKGRRLQGYLAWIVWRGAYLTRTVSWRNKLLVPVYWVVNWVFGRDMSRF